MIEGGDLSGDAQRMVQRKKLDGGAHPKTVGPGHDPARDQERRRQHGARRVDQHLRQPHDVEPPRFTRVGELEKVLEPLVLGASAPYLLREDSEVHDAPLLRRRRGGVDRQIPRSARNLA